MKNNQNKELMLIEDLGMLYPAETSKQKKRFGLYKCFCGNEFKAQVPSIKNGNTKSCGCSERTGNTKHNLYHHRLYKLWQHMLDRCNNINADNYKYYGGRGITVCDEWTDVKTFIEDMYPTFEEGLTLDREDNEVGYSKANCRWSTKSVQMRNTRRIRINNTSGYRGVGWNKISNRFVAMICVNSKQIHLGLFETAIEGARAYDSYVIKNNLEHTRNFI